MSAPVLAANGGAGGGGGGSFDFQVRPIYYQVSPTGVLPQYVPNCITNSTAVPSSPILVCYSPDFMQMAYGFDDLYADGYAGDGQTIVIVDAYGSPTIRADLEFFDATFGLPDPPSFEIVCPLGCPHPSPNNHYLDPGGWGIETTLDVEWAHALAPNANIVLATAPSPAGASLAKVLDWVNTHYEGVVVTQSFGVPEYAIVGNNNQINQMHATYAAAAWRDNTFLASAGDWGATNGLPATANALYPSSDPYVLAIGGTQGNDYPYGLSTFTGSCDVSNRPGYPGCSPTGYGGEETWNEGWAAAATGGAPSLIYPTPSWQSGVTGYNMRTTPDVSLNAAINGGVLVFTSNLGGPAWFVVGGTSASSPEWASLLAIVNQARADSNLGPIGFANDDIYTLAQSSDYSATFHDITVGDDQLAGTSVGYSAGTGYDLATGWGTPIGPAFVAAMC